MEYDFNIINKASIKHHATNTLSRLNSKKADDSDIDDDIPVMAVNTRAQTRWNKYAYTTLDTNVNETIEAKLSIRNGFLSARSTDAYWEKTQPTVRMPEWSFNFDKNGTSVRLLKMNGAVQEVMQRSLRPIILHSAHHSTLARHRGECRVYDMFRCEYVWPSISINLYSTVWHWRVCLQIRTKLKHKCQIQVFSPSDSLVFIAIDIIGPLPWTKSGNNYKVIVTDWYNDTVNCLSQFQRWKYLLLTSRTYFWTIGLPPMVYRIYYYLTMASNLSAFSLLLYVRILPLK